MKVFVGNFDIQIINIVFQLISDAGFQGEITSISTAAQQIEVFSRVLKSAIVGFLQSSDDWQNSVNECAVRYKLLYIFTSFVT